MNATMLVGLLLLFAVIGLIGYVIGLYNTLVRLANNIRKAWSNIDVVLKQRHHELPKLVEVCNSYMAHERDTLEAVTKARMAYDRGASIDDKAKAENQLAGALGRLLAVAEGYPDLKANQEFLHIQQRISVLESTIADRREFFNESVNLYNIKVAQCPSVLIANQFGYTPHALLEVLKTEREHVQLAFANRPSRT